MRPTVGMMHATPWWIAGADGGLERSNSEPCIDEARRLDGGNFQAAAQLVHDKGCKRLAFHIFGNDEEWR